MIQKSLDIIEYKKANPCISGSAIARKFNVSRQRINQILAGAGLASASAKRGEVKNCIDCGTRLADPRAVRCGECYRSHLEDEMVPVVCDECGTVFKRRKCQVIFDVKRGYNLSFCNRECLGRYTGKRNKNRIYRKDRPI